MAIKSHFTIMQIPVLPILVIVICWTLNVSEARFVRDSMAKKTSKCPHLSNEGLHAVLDRVCEECFVMFRFMDPDVGAKCKRRCFKNDHYQWCAAALSNNELAYPDRIQRHTS